MIPDGFKNDVFEHVIKLVFIGGLDSDWQVFKASTNNDYFSDELEDYLWIAFNDKNLNVLIISASLTF